MKKKFYDWNNKAEGDDNFLLLFMQTCQKVRGDASKCSTNRMCHTFPDMKNIVVDKQEILKYGSLW